MRTLGWLNCYDIELNCHLNLTATASFLCNMPTPPPPSYIILYSYYSSQTTSRYMEILFRFEFEEKHFELSVRQEVEIGPLLPVVVVANAFVRCVLL